MVGRIAPFLKDGLTGAESVLVIVDSRKRELLRHALGGDGDAVSYLDRDTFYTRPEDALARYDARLRQLVRDGVGAVRAFAELPRCAGSADVDPWIRYEAVVNRALAHHPLWVVCGYDAREMPAALFESALETHQEVLVDEWEPSTGYRAPEAVVRSRTPRPVRRGPSALRRAGGGRGGHAHGRRGGTRERSGTRRRAGGRARRRGRRR